MSAKPTLPLKRRASKKLARKPQRSLLISHRVNAEELDKYREEANRHGFGVSAWIRAVLSNGCEELASLRSRQAAPIADPRLLCQLVQIWNDIDDARRLIRDKHPSTDALLRRRFLMIEKHLRKLAGLQG